MRTSVSPWDTDRICNTVDEVGDRYDLTTPLRVRLAAGLHGNGPNGQVVGPLSGNRYMTPDEYAQHLLKEPAFAGRSGADAPSGVVTPGMTQDEEVEARLEKMGLTNPTAEQRLTEVYNVQERRRKEAAAGAGPSEAPPKPADDPVADRPYTSPERALDAYFDARRKEEKQTQEWKNRHGL